MLITNLKFLFFGYFLLVPLGSVLGHIGFTYAFNFFKIIFLLFFFSGLYTFLIKLKKNSKFDILSILLIFGFFYALIVGLFTNIINTFFISHLYTAIMPILMVSFGRYILDYYKGDVFLLFKPILHLSKPLLLLIIAYFFLYQVGIISYFGVSTQASFIFILSFFFRAKNHSIFSILAVILSGKRGGLLTSLSGLFFYYIFQLMKNPVKYFNKITIVFISISIFVLFLYNYTDLLKRFLPLLEVDFSDDYSLFLATGGRSLEFISIYNHIVNNNLILFGGGMGEFYSLKHNLSVDSEYSLKGFSHFSPISLLFLYGLPYTIFIYLTLINLAVKIRIYVNGFLSVVILMGLVSSLGGSILMYDPFYWLIVGVSTRVQFWLKNK